MQLPTVTISQLQSDGQLLLRNIPALFPCCGAIAVQASKLILFGYREKKKIPALCSQRSDTLRQT
jgi:hypothetical protein